MTVGLKAGAGVARVGLRAAIRIEDGADPCPEEEQEIEELRESKHSDLLRSRTASGHHGRNGGPLNRKCAVPSLEKS